MATQRQIGNNAAGNSIFVGIFEDIPLPSRTGGTASQSGLSELPLMKFKSRPVTTFLTPFGQCEVHLDLPKAVRACL
jgi:hypothetical protein